MRDRYLHCNQVSQSQQKLTAVLPVFVCDTAVPVASKPQDSPEASHPGDLRRAVGSLGALPVCKPILGKPGDISRKLKRGTNDNEI